MSYRFCLGASGAGKSTYLHREALRLAADALDRFDFDRNIMIVVPDQFTMQTQKDLVLAAGAYGARFSDVPGNGTASGEDARGRSRTAVLAAGSASPHSSRGGIMNIDVLSFGRLSHRIFEEIGADTGGALDDMGKTLILRRLASGCMKDLQVLGQRMSRPGMIAEVKSVISEFMQYGISVDGVGELASYAASHGQGALAAKLADLQVLYRAFLEERASRFLTGEELLDLLAEAIPKSKLISRSIVIFDGFTGFTPVQYRAIAALLQCAPEVILALDWADDGGTPIGDVMAGAPYEEQDLFCLTRQTVSQICRLGEQCGAAHGEDLYIEGGQCRRGSSAALSMENNVCPPRFRGNPALAHLERALFRNPVRVYGQGEADTVCGAGSAESGAVEGGAGSAGMAGAQGTQGSAASDGTLPVHLILASNPGQEVRQMFIRIRKLIAEKGYHYRDIAVVAGDLTAYEEEIRVYAERYEVPVYIDSRRIVTQNPLTETIRSALEIGGGDYSYETVFRFLRGGLSGMEPDAVDRLENYCLKRGIASRRRWETAFDLEYEPMRQAFLTAIRPLRTPGRSQAQEQGAPEEMESGAGPVARRRQNAQDRTRALYDFLLGIHAGEQMQAKARRLREQGQSARAMEYEQIYGAVIHLLDELYELPGQEPISSKDYQDLVTAGFQEIRIGTLPQQVDRIQVGDMERTRIPEVKVLFLLGVNDGNIPKDASGGGLLSDLDREFLQESGVLTRTGISLAPSPREQMYNQRLYLYMNLTKPSKELYVSYAAVDGDGRSIRPSYLIGLLQQMLPQMETEVPEEAPVPEQMTAPKDAAGFLAGALRDYADGLFLQDPVRRDEVLTIYGFCVRERPDTRLLREAAFRRYRPVPLTEETSQQIYGRSIRGSVTRLETAAQCYLQQFLRYGLRLRERERYTFEANDSGNIMHESIQRFGVLLQQAGISWTDFTREQGRTLMAGALRDAAGGYNDQILYDSARSTYQATRLQRILERTADTLQYQLLQGDFTPWALEQDFGGGGELSFALRNGGRVTLRGRIDRVDLARDDGIPDAGASPASPGDRIYVKIVDYKSGKKDLDPVKMKAGLQLQLLLYMMAEVDRLRGQNPGTEIIPAGMLYYRFDDPPLSGDNAAKVLATAVSGDSGEQLPPGGPDAEPSMYRDLTAAAAEEERILRRQLRPKGLVGAEEDILQHLDRSLSGVSTESLAVPVKRNKDGSLSKTSRTYSAEEYQTLSGALRETVCRLAEDILDGRTDAAPVRTDAKHSACTWCAYRDACGFDPRIPGYEYRDLKDLPQESTGKPEGG